MSDPSTIEQMSQGMGILQTGVAVATAVGAGAVARGLWRQATLAYDERLILELASYKSAQERAQEIRKHGKLDVDPAMGAALEDLATQLDQQADQGLRYAVARASWRNSTPRKLGHGGLASGMILVYFMGILYVGLRQSEPHWYTAFLGPGLTLISLTAILFGMLNLTVIKDLWLSAEVKNQKRYYHRQVRSIKPEIKPSAHIDPEVSEKGQR